MTKFKHNKKRNPAFLYEVLVQELAKSVKGKNDPLRQGILSTLKEFFHKETNIGKELKIYRAILGTKDVDELIGEKILREAKRAHDQIDKAKLAEEQNNLFFKLKKIVPNVFSNFVPNYKDLASVAQIFNQETSIRTRVLLENEILGKMTSKLLKEETKLVPIDNLVMNSFIKKFNEQYKELHEEQKTLLNKFITSFVDNGLPLKVFLNEEIKRLKIEITNSLTLKEFVEDPMMLEHGKSVLKLLESFASTPIDDKLVSQVIKVQNLIREIKS